MRRLDGDCGVGADGSSLTGRGEPCSWAISHPHYAETVQDELRVLRATSSSQPRSPGAKRDLSVLIDDKTSCGSSRTPTVRFIRDLSGTGQSRADERRACSVTRRDRSRFPRPNSNAGAMGVGIVAAEGSRSAMGLNFGGPYSWASCGARKIRAADAGRDAGEDRGRTCSAACAGNPLDARNSLSDRGRRRATSDPNSELCARLFVHLSLLGDEGLRRLARTQTTHARCSWPSGLTGIAERDDHARLLQRVHAQAEKPAALVTDSIADLGLVCGRADSGSIRMSLRFAPSTSRPPSSIPMMTSSLRQALEGDRIERKGRPTGFRNAGTRRWDAPRPSQGIGSAQEAAVFELARRAAPAFMYRREAVKGCLGGLIRKTAPGLPAYPNRRPSDIMSARVRRNGLVEANSIRWLVQQEAQSAAERKDRAPDGFADIHPMQPQKTAAGRLRPFMAELSAGLRRITGDRRHSLYQSWRSRRALWLLAIRAALSRRGEEPHADSGN